jgi:predicted Zn-dependent protease
MKLTMVALAFLASVPGARAEVVKHPTAGLQIELPAGWKTRTNAGQLVAEPADGKAYVSFAVIDESAIDGYVAKWADGMKGGLTDLQVDVDAETSEVNGLQHAYSVGSAKLEGKPIQWDLTIVKGAKKVLAVMALGEDLDGDAVQKMYASIRRLAPDGRPATKGELGVGPSDPKSGSTYPPDDNEAPGEAADEPPPGEEPPNDSRRY